MYIEKMLPDGAWVIYVNRLANHTCVNYVNLLADRTQANYVNLRDPPR